MVNLSLRDPKFTNGIGILKRADNPSKTISKLDDRLNGKRKKGDDILCYQMRLKKHCRRPYGRLRKTASRSYTKAGRSVSSSKGNTLKVEALRSYELFRVRFSTPCPRTFGSYYVLRLLG
ncbi:hypothetical protein TNCV_2099271 [Trichonephila clavipes]|nr:hypothetical protein TNCV_2099271 [Trichonephila clavipes]